MDVERPEAQGAGGHRIAEEATRWQAEQRGAPQPRGTGGWLGALALVALAAVWLGLCGIVLAMSVALATAEDGGEVLFLAPPIYLALSAVGTGLVIDVRCRIVRRGPSIGRIVGSVLAGAFAGFFVGTGLAIALSALFMELIGNDFSSPAASSAWFWATTFLIFVLPVIAGVRGVLFFVNGWTLRGPRRDDPG